MCTLRRVPVRGIGLLFAAALIMHLADTVQGLTCSQPLVLDKFHISPEVVSVVVSEYVDSCIYVTLARCFKLVHFFPSLCYPIQLKNCFCKIKTWRNCYCFIVIRGPGEIRRRVM